MRPLFIGGTGRSGTTVLGRTLSYHKDIFTIPFESRFIVDPDGLVDLVRSLVDDWEQYHAHTAIERFEKLMKEIYPSKYKHLTKIALFLILPKFHISPPKYTFTISKFWKDEDFFDYKVPPFSLFMERRVFLKLLNSFLQDLVTREYKGYWSGYGIKVSPKMRVTTYCKECVYSKSREFAERLITPVAKRYGAKIWADHTPTNIAHVLFLHKLFPDMKFIHIYRDPRDVVSSYKTKSWGGNSAKDAVPIINGMLKKWEMDKKNLPKDTYIEVSLEELVSSTEKTLNRICEFLGVEFDKNMLKMDLSKSHSGRWKKDLSREEVELVEKELGWFMRDRGYL